MAMTKERKAEIIKKYQTSKNDVGSAQVQIALLTEEINTLTEHFKVHIHDFHSKRGLDRMVGRRKKLLSYLKDTDVVAYRELIKSLGLRK
ncbi:MAG: 30S ribosomal protein S15 [Bacilli bacterium]|nr:30S ribosomal protein S15 [Bacilli bacterium]MBR1748475.1 30S ribosomal protein S15 [Bacilli bacterium]MBR1817782.1 30S ribosomal protein S15 [Bacilli bacterium]